MPQLIKTMIWGFGEGVESRRGAGSAIYFFLLRGVAGCDCEIERSGTFWDTNQRIWGKRCFEPLPSKGFFRSPQYEAKTRNAAPFCFWEKGRLGRKSEKPFKFRVLLFVRGLSDCSVLFLIRPRVELQSSGCHRRVSRLPQSQAVLHLSTRAGFVR